MGYIYILIAAVFWGGLGIPVTKLKELGLTAYEIGAMRSLGGALILAVILILKRDSFKIKLKYIPLLIGVGIASQAGLNIGYFIAISNLGLGVAVVLLYTSPVFANISAYIVYKEKFTLGKILAVTFSIIGCFLATTGGSSAVNLSLIGIAAGIFSGFSFGMNPVLSKKLHGKIDVLQILFYSFLFGGIIQLFFVDIINYPGKMSLEVLQYGAILATIPTIGAFFLYNKGLKTVAPGLVSILCVMEVVAATIVSRFYFLEYLNTYKILGVVLIIIASVLPSLKKPKVLKKRQLV